VLLIVKRYSRFGQIVFRFLNTQGQKNKLLEYVASQIDVVRKLKKKIYYGDASRLDILEAAGTKDAKYFVLAIDDVDKSVKTARVVQKNFPEIQILARARNRHHVMELMKLGVTEIYRETLLTSLEVAKNIMLHKGANKESIDLKLSQFLKKDYEILEKQFELQEDGEEYISFTTKANKELVNYT
jgi:voltage-gated potassium channel Kch